jgi:hypothetical protein
MRSTLDGNRVYKTLQHDNAGEWHANSFTTASNRQGEDCLRRINILAHLIAQFSTMAV